LNFSSKKLVSLFTKKMGFLSGILGASMFSSDIRGVDRITEPSATPCELTDGFWDCQTSKQHPDITDVTEQVEAATNALFDELAETKVFLSQIAPIEVDDNLESPMTSRRSWSDIDEMASEEILFDFTTIVDLDNWVESSDTVREVGMSKASFVLQKTQKYQRAVFFALLNPQPSGACFAGVYSETDFDSSMYKAIWLKLRGIQGTLWRYKVILRNQGISAQRNYEAFFKVNGTASNSELDITLPLDEFQAYYRGKPDTNAPPLNSSNVISLGVQAAGGVYDTEKQSGAGAIEIDWIVLIN